jgi:mRNA interferase RelE/StbE
MRKLDRTNQDRVIAALERFAANPDSGDVKALRGQANLLRLRIGDYRVIFGFDPPARAIHIVRVAHRRDVYR